MVKAEWIQWTGNVGDLTKFSNNDEFSVVADEEKINATAITAYILTSLIAVLLFGLYISHLKRLSIGKKHALEKYDHFAIQTSCVWVFVYFNEKKPQLIHWIESYNDITYFVFSPTEKNANELKCQLAIATQEKCYLISKIKKPKNLRNNTGNGNEERSI